jgi:predicted Zn-dependent protease
MKLNSSEQVNMYSSKLQQEDPSTLNESLNRLIETGILARAADLARKGELQQAELLLQPLVNKPEAPTSTLDLLAKIYGQQRKMKEAQAMWLRALNMEPSNRHFLRALLRCSDFMKENGGYL